MHSATENFIANMISYTLLKSSIEYRAQQKGKYFENEGLVLFIEYFTFSFIIYHLKKFLLRVHYQWLEPNFPI